MLTAIPPSMTPIFAVVSWSMRPSFICAMPSAATWMALMPLSGQTPAWASRPWTRNSRRFAPGPRVKRKPTESLSNTKPVRARSLPVSRHFAPTNPDSSQIVKTTSMSPWGMILLLQNPHGFANDRHPALVVATEHGTAVGAKNIAFEYGNDAFARHHRIHMGREQKGTGGGRGPREACNQIADVAADFLARVVDGDRRAQVLHLAFEAHGDVVFFARQTVDFYQLDEQVFDAFLVDQTINLGFHGLRAARACSSSMVATLERELSCTESTCHGSRDRAKPRRKCAIDRSRMPMGR